MAERASARSDAAGRKRAAVGFLRAVATGTDPHAAAARLFAPNAKHHNVWFPAGMTPLLDAMGEAYRKNPETRIEVLHTVAEGSFVAVHSHVRHRPGDAGIAVVHLFRFARGRAAELWDVAMQVPEKTPNADGAF
jgi:predicted SnoaL-like aldol condensation-catalyzing enzyme